MVRNKSGLIIQLNRFSEKTVSNQLSKKQKTVCEARIGGTDDCRGKKKLHFNQKTL